MLSVSKEHCKNVHPLVIHSQQYSACSTPVAKTFIRGPFFGSRLNGHRGFLELTAGILHAPAVHGVDLDRIGRFRILNPIEPSPGCIVPAAVDLTNSLIGDLPQRAQVIILDGGESI